MTNLKDNINSRQRNKVKNKRYEKNGGLECWGKKGRKKKTCLLEFLKCLLTKIHAIKQTEDYYERETYVFEVILIWFEVQNSSSSARLVLIVIREKMAMIALTPLEKRQVIVMSQPDSKKETYGGNTLLIFQSQATDILNRLLRIYLS